MCIESDKTIKRKRIMNADKIKVLEKAIQWLETEDNYFGICDAIRFSSNELHMANGFREPIDYGIQLPPKVYHTSDGQELAFCYPCTSEGKQQRIEVLQQAINRLKTNTMTQDERRQVINKIIIMTFKGVKMDAIYFNDRFEALSKLSDEELLGQQADLN